MDRGHGRMTMSDSRRTSVVTEPALIETPDCEPDTPGDAERRDREMNAFAVFAVNEHLEYLLAEAAQRRMADTLPKKTLRGRIASVATSVKSAFTTSAETTPSILPRLEDYPYRS
jgi:hypothetical protein